MIAKESYKLVVHEFTDFGKKEPARYIELFYLIRDKREGNWAESLGHIKITKEIKQWLKDAANGKDVKNITFKM